MNERVSQVLADASVVGAVRFARAVPEADLPDLVRTFPSDLYSTFTDALLAYAAEARIDLRHSGCVMAVAAPPTGDAIRLARTRWTISRSGLDQMFGGRVTVTNDVAATAWSMLGIDRHRIEPLDKEEASATLAGPGRWAVVLLEDGLGVGALDIAEDGRVTVIDTEAGNAGFSPASDTEYALMRTLRQQRPHVSWEHMLIGADGQVVPDQSWAEMVGSFVGDQILALGAWNGVVLTGRHAAAFRDPRRYAAFSQRLEGKARYARHLAMTRRYILPQRDHLHGCLALLKARDRGMMI